MNQSLTVLFIATCASTSIAELTLPPCVSRDQLNGAAKSAGFTDADFPFYSSTNGCGPDGWKNKIVPEKSIVLLGADFSAACNQHDRDYMTLGMSREAADARFRAALHGAVNDYLKETVTHTVRVAFKRVVKVEETYQIPKQVVKTSLKKVWKKPWKLIMMPVVVTETVMEDAKRIVEKEIEDFRDDVKLVTRASTLSPDQIATMHRSADLYADFVETLGESYYNGSQTKQAAFEAWSQDFVRNSVCE
ncbi:MAG: hypothetical protein ACK5XN_32715 [Bacteroidota bacterium]